MLTIMKLCVRTVLGDLFLGLFFFLVFYDEYRFLVQKVFLNISINKMILYTKAMTLA